MSFFNKQELAGILTILLLIFVVSFISFQASLRRGRDEQRISDLDNLSRALQQYHNSFGTYPPSLETGKIVACKSDNPIPIPDELTEINDRYVFLLYDGRACEWGEDPLADYYGNTENFMDYLPIDPANDKGIAYVYISNGEEYQIFTHLESQIKDKYDLGLEERNISCGTALCNYGKGSGKLILEKVVDEYQNDIRDRLIVE